MLLLNRERSVKIVVVGDKHGANERAIKTEMLVTYTTNAFPGEYLPAVFSNWLGNIVVAGISINLGLWDTSNQESEDYDRLRPLSYPQTDCFILMFSVMSPAAYENIRTRWFPEVMHHCPNAKCIVAGAQIELRDDIGLVKELKEKGITPITAEMGVQLAKDIRASAYCEFSAYTMQGVRETIETATLAGMEKCEVGGGEVWTVDVNIGYLKRAAGRGDAQAKTDLSSMANKKNGLDAQYAMGELMLKGEGFEKDEEAGIGYLKKAAGLGHAQAQCYLGILYMTALPVPDYKEAYRWSRKAYDEGRGNKAAGCHLGVLSAYGLGVEPSMSMAIRYYQDASADGDPLAHVLLGVCYTIGSGGSPTIDEITEAGVLFRKANFGEYKGRSFYAYANFISLFERLSEQGHASAWLMLAVVYGCGLLRAKKDSQNAVVWSLLLEWVLKGEESAYPKLQAIAIAGEGDVFTQYQLGLAYKYQLGLAYSREQKKLGIERNMREALKWFDLAARGGCVKAARQLHRWQDNDDVNVQEDLALAGVQVPRSLTDAATDAAHGVRIAIPEWVVIGHSIPEWIVMLRLVEASARGMGEVLLSAYPDAFAKERWPELRDKIREIEREKIKKGKEAEKEEESDGEDEKDVKNESIVNNKPIVKLDFSYNQLRDAMVPELVGLVMQLLSLHTLVLDFNLFTKSGLQDLLKGLAKHPQLRELSFKGNRIKDADRSELMPPQGDLYVAATHHVEVPKRIDLTLNLMVSQHSIVPGKDKQKFLALLAVLATFDCSLSELRRIKLKGLSQKGGGSYCVGYQKEGDNTLHEMKGMRYKHYNNLNNFHVHHAGQSGWRHTSDALLGNEFNIALNHNGDLQAINVTQCGPSEQQEPDGERRTKQKECEQKEIVKRLFSSYEESPLKYVLSSSSHPIFYHRPVAKDIELPSLLKPGFFVMPDRWIVYLMAYKKGDEHAFLAWEGIHKYGQRHFQRADLTIEKAGLLKHIMGGFKRDDLHVNWRNPPLSDAVSVKEGGGADWFETRKARYHIAAFYGTREQVKKLAKAVSQEVNSRHIAESTLGQINSMVASSFLSSGTQVKDIPNIQDINCIKWAVDKINAHVPQEKPLEAETDKATKLPSLPSHVVAYYEGELEPEATSSASASGKGEGRRCVVM